MSRLRKESKKPREYNSNSSKILPCNQISLIILEEEEHTLKTLSIKSIISNSILSQEAQEQEQLEQE